THRPIALGEAKPPQAPRPLKAEKATALTRQVDALATATETLRSRLAAKAATPEQTRPEPAEKKPAAVKAKAGAKRPPRRVTGPAPETAPAKSPRPRSAAGKTRPRRATGKPKT